MSDQENAAKVARTEQWRLGTKILINVYAGDRPVCQCHTVWDATRIVQAINHVPELEDTLRAYRADHDDDESPSLCCCEICEWAKGLLGER